MNAPDLLHTQPWSVWACLGLGAILFVVSPLVYLVSRKTPVQVDDIPATDIATLQQVNRNILLSEQRLRSIIAATTEGFWMIEPDSQEILDVNEAMCSMLGYAHSEMVGKSPLEFVDNKNRLIFQHQSNLPHSAAHHSYEITLKTKTGKDLHVQLNSTTIPGTTNPYCSSICFAFVTDISDRKRHEDELYRQAHYDTTTGLPNRHFLLKHLSALVDANEPFGVLLLDLDNFKLYNDTLGHALGDLALMKIATRLKSELPDDAFMARLSGDEFVIVSRRSRTAVSDLGKQLNAMLAEPTVASDIDLYVGASIGVALFPDDGADVDHLLKNADLAMYQAKALGKGCLCEFTPALDLNLRTKLELGGKLRNALQQDEFELYYQPQISAASGAIVGVEALLRWNHPEMGMVMPDRFIPLLEETGLILPIGRWVIENACRQTLSWHWNDQPIRLSVNLSSRQFQETDFPSIVNQILSDTGFEASRLILEITESLLIDNSPQLAKRLTSITDLGVSFSIDDFGTGYSSLSYLQKYPIKEVKIDQAFVKGLSKNNGDMMIVKTIVAMAASLGMETVAEGVEQQEQLQVLTEIGVHLIQGYFTGRPMPESAALDHLNNKRAGCLTVTSASGRNFDDSGPIRPVAENNLFY